MTADEGNTVDVMVLTDAGRLEQYWPFSREKTQIQHQTQLRLVTHSASLAGSGRETGAPSREDPGMGSTGGRPSAKARASLAVVGDGNLVPRPRLASLCMANHVKSRLSGRAGSIALAVHHGVDLQAAVQAPIRSKLASPLFWVRMSAKGRLVGACLLWSCVHGVVVVVGVWEFGVCALATPHAIGRYTTTSVSLGKPFNQELAASVVWYLDL